MTACESLRTAGIDVDDSTLVRALYAHDASNYRITPVAVAFPRSADEVAVIARICAQHALPITVRGAGTGMAGNSIGAGLIVDVRRHLRGIRFLDNASVHVEPGVVLDELQAAALPLGHRFGPDPSSHSRATIGGMIGNDACGPHSVAYGRTSDHVLQLDLVLADGTRATATREGLFATDADGESRVTELVGQLRAANAAAGAWLREFGRFPRQVSGYGAQHLATFDIARLLVGSEGTLAIVVGATLQLVPVPRLTQLMVLGYSDLIEAARDLPLILETQPCAIEAIDTAIVETMRARRGVVPALPEGEAWLFVEFAESEGPEALHARLSGRGASILLVSNDDATALWRVREEGAGLASNLLDGTRGRPGWEDAAVPPERLAEYLTQLRDLQTRHGFTGVLYGHFGAGCVHVRFDFDTDTESGRAAMRAFILEAAALVARFGGSVSGEHGDGRARGELLPLMYSESAMGCLRAIKRAFDPDGLLNPQAMIDAPPLNENMPTRMPAGPSAFAFPHDGGDLARAASRCVGIGRCVATGVTHMCPTYGVHRDERDSTRGRARAVQDLFGSGLTSKDALLALDDCLSCKACATDCPTGVDIATVKSEVLHRHFRGRLRPATHYLFGWLPRLALIAAPVAALVNGIMRRKYVRRLLPALGVTSQRLLPRLATVRERQALVAPTEGAPAALLFVDTFTRNFQPDVAACALRVLRAAGIPVRVVNDGCCGLTWITTGQLGTAKRVQRQWLDIVDTQPPVIPIIVLEPSCAASLASDLPQLDPRGASAAARIRTFASALNELAPDWPWPSLPRTAVLQVHCHEQAIFPGQSALLRERGVSTRETIGCCGMGGNFGFESAHHDMSVAVAQRSLVPALDAGAEAVLVDGFGCRCQVEHLRPGAAPMHLAQLLASAL